MAGNELFNKLVRENEELTTDIERSRNENNVLRIEITELKLRASNFQADLRVEEGVQADLKKQVTSLQEQLNEAIARAEESASALEAREAEIRTIERQVGCRLSEFGRVHNRTERLLEEVEVYKRELAFLKNVKHRVDESFVTETRVQAILDDFYKSLGVAQQTAEEATPELKERATANDTPKNSILMQKVTAYEEELSVQRQKAAETTARTEELERALKRAKETVIALNGEVESHRQRGTLSDNRTHSADYKKTIKSLERFEADLKGVYSSCIDLFVSLDKTVLIRMEKSLNDCVMAFGEIREALIECPPPRA